MSEDCRVAAPYEYLLTATSRGRPKLLHEGYIYIQHIRHNVKNIYDKMKHWRCMEKRTLCKAKIIMFPDKSILLKESHNHDPQY